MKPLFDHHTDARIAALRQMQGLPFDIPAGQTVFRQSDFEQSKIWRCVFIAAFVVGIASLCEPEPKPATPTAVHAPSNVGRVYVP